MRNPVSTAMGIIPVLCIFLAAPSLCDDIAAAQWADHPALQSFGLENTCLPEDLYLVRTRGSIPYTHGITVHGENAGLYIVSGEEQHVMDLTMCGCGVYPISPMAASASEYETSHRVWKPVTVADPDIEALVSQVNWSHISSTIQWLVEFETRYTYADNHMAVAGAIADRFAETGLAPELFSYELNGSDYVNVVATQTGTVYPDSVIIVCGHLDSVSGDPYNSAPGADDNGTGTAAVLCLSELLAGHSFQYSIRYICFSGEEQGLKGSQAYASWAAQNDEPIVGVLNFDMLGYWEPGVEMDLEIEANEASQWFAEAILNAADLYTETPYELHIDNGAWWGDHASFWGQGFTAVNHEEAWDWGDPDFNPYYHSVNDLLVYIGEDFMVGNLQLAVAALATLAVYDTSSGSEANTSLSMFSPVLMVNPNPFSDHADVIVQGFSDLSVAEVQVYDVSGRVVDRLEINLASGSGSTTWNPSASSAWNLRPGVFYMTVSSETQVGCSKILFTGR